MAIYCGADLSMQINIQNPVQQTAIFIVVFVLLVLGSLRKRHNNGILEPTDTTELKGVAILMVLFGHLGYFLASDSRFLWPLSVASGVGVNIFFFLSGYGLTASYHTKRQSVSKFLNKRLISVFPAMWIVMTLLFIFDYCLLGRTYNFGYIFRSFLGLFPSADLYKDVNSPLWYFTPIVIYYFLLSMIFKVKKPLIASAILVGIGWFAVTQNLPVDKDVLKLYQTHFMAFPLGIAFFSFLKYSPTNHIINIVPRSIKYFVILVSALVLGYTAIYSRVGEGMYNEQIISLATMLTAVTIFIFKNINSRFLIVLGTFSYEIYLIHWPLLSRYDVIYKNLPASVATFAYLGLFIVLSLGLKKITRYIH